MKATFKILVISLIAVVLLSACGSAEETKKVSYSLTTNLQDGRMLMIGASGDIFGVVNPTLHASVGDTVEVTLTSGDFVEHNISFPDFNAASGPIMGQGSSVTLTFVADKGGTFNYSCTIPGHIDAGMIGEFVVSEPAQ